METTQETKTALTPAEEVRQELAKQGMADAAIADMKKKYSVLTIVNLDDKEGYKKVYEARQEIKKARIGVEKFCKQKRDVFNAMNKAISAEEKRLTDELIALENKLQAEEDKVKKWAEEKAQERLNKMVVELLEIGFENTGTASTPIYSIPGFKVDRAVLVAFNDKEFAEFCSKALAAMEALKEQKEREAEEKRQEEIKRRKSELAEVGFALVDDGYHHKSGMDLQISFPETSTPEEYNATIAEARRLNKAKADALAAELKKKEDDLKAEQERIRKEQEAEAERLRLEREKIEREKKELEIQKQKSRYERLQGIGMKWNGKDFVFDSIYASLFDACKMSDHEFEETVKALTAEIQRVKEKEERDALRIRKMKDAGITIELKQIFIYVGSEKKYSAQLDYALNMSEDQFEKFLSDCAEKIEEWERDLAEKTEEHMRKVAEEQKKREQEEIARKEALRPDKEKIIKFAEETFTIVKPQIEFTNDAARLLFNKYSLALCDTLRDMKLEAEKL